MQAMTERIQVREAIFAGLHSHGDQIVEMGEKTVCVLGDAEERKGRNPRALAELKVGRALGDYRLYVIYEQWVEEYVYGKKKPVGIHPVYSFVRDDVRKLSEILRGEWSGGIVTDRDGIDQWVEPVKGQEARVFLVEGPRPGSKEYDLVTSFLSRAHFSSARKAKVYVYSNKSPLFGFASNADGIIFNFASAIWNREVVLYTGRPLAAYKRDEVLAAKPFIEAVGFTVDEIYRAKADVLYRFCIASMRFATIWWDRDTIPMTKLARTARPDVSGDYVKWLEAISEKKRLALRGEMVTV